MSKAGIIVTSVLVYAACVTGAILYSRNHFEKKDTESYNTTYNSLDKYFRKRGDVASVMYSNENVEYKRVSIPNESDYIGKTPPMMIKEDVIGNKKRYEFRKAYGDVARMYEFIPRYGGDLKYNGFCVSVFHWNGDYISEYHLVPKYIGLKTKELYEGKVDNIVNNALGKSLNYLKNKKFRTGFSEKRITWSTISDKGRSEYYKLFEVNTSQSHSEIENSAWIGEDSKMLNHDRGYYLPEDYWSYNEFGFNTLYEDKYCKVFLEAIPVRMMKIRYDFLYNPLSQDIKKFLIITISALTAVLAVVLFFTLRRKKQ